MAQSKAHTTALSISGVQTQSLTYQGERRLRRISAWLLLLFLLQGELGAVWDREWHAYVGRDQFWTPPHTLIYSCVAGAGLLALMVVFLETSRYYHQKPGVNDDSTVAIFRFFHAPLGFSVLGFGALCALCAAPLDNYWHELYGIDIALWAPFHMMGVIGGLIGMLGMVYVFASEAAIQRHTKEQAHTILGLRPLEIGLIMTLASIMNYVLTGFLQFPIVTIGTMHISTYPLPLVTGGALCLIAALRVTRRPGIATLFTLLVCVHTIIVELFVPWAIRYTTAQQGIPYRVPGQIPSFSLSYAFFPIVLLIPALIIDIVAWRKIHRQHNNAITITFPEYLSISALIGLCALILSPLLLHNYSPYAPIFLPEPGISIPTVQRAAFVIISTLITIGMGGLGVFLGEEFGSIWRWNRR
jgi:hypothetical protein